MIHAVSSRLPLSAVSHRVVLRDLLAGRVASARVVSPSETGDASADRPGLSRSRSSETLTARRRVPFLVVATLTVRVRTLSVRSVRDDADGPPGGVRPTRRPTRTPPPLWRLAGRRAPSRPLDAADTASARPGTTPTVNYISIYKRAHAGERYRHRPLSSTSSAYRAPAVVPVRSVRSSRLSRTDVWPSTHVEASTGRRTTPRKTVAVR